MNKLKPRRKFLLSSALAAAGELAFSRIGRSVEDNGSVVAWRRATISPVSKAAARHTMHTYYLLNPESPDGRRVLFFASGDIAGHIGQICMLDKQTGIETVLVDDVHARVHAIRGVGIGGEAPIERHPRFPRDGLLLRTAGGPVHPKTGL